MHCTRVAQYQFFLIDSISIILFPFLSIPISISINLKRAYQYQYVINYWKIPLSISISISINLLPYQYQFFSTHLKSLYYKSAAAEIVRQRSLESMLHPVYLWVGYHTTPLSCTPPPPDKYQPLSPPPTLYPLPKNYSKTFRLSFSLNLQDCSLELFTSHLNQCNADQLTCYKSHANAVYSILFGDDID